MKSNNACLIRKKVYCGVLLSVLQVNAVVQSQVKVSEPPLVAIAKASGEIFLEKDKREYTPKFTEVDISKYASGIVYAELRLSSGGCDAMVITTAIPTNDRRNNVGYFSVASGKSATERLPGLEIRDGMINYFDKKLSRFNKSPKFYISADFRMQGMGLWYAQDCSGTYEITVYLKNGKKFCGALPAIPSELSRRIADLSRLTRYDERSKTYHEIHQELQKRGIGLGFFEAASTVTGDFSEIIIAFEPKTQSLLNNLSRELAGMNAKYAIELLQTGKLEAENRSGYFSDLTAIDNELVRREQVFAEQRLSSLSENREIIEGINRGTNAWISRNLVGLHYKSVTATNEVRSRKRKRNPNAEFDYGDIKDRTSVGEILAGQFRNNSLPNAILCK